MFGIHKRKMLFFSKENRAANVAWCVFDCLFFWIYVGILLHIVSGIPLRVPKLMTHMLSLYDFTTLTLCGFAYPLPLGPDPFDRPAVLD